MHIEYIEGEWVYTLSPYKSRDKDYLIVRRAPLKDSNDWIGWSGPYADAPISEEMRAYLDRALKLKAFW